MIHDLYEVFGSYIKALEMIRLGEGKKPVVRHLYTRQELEKVYDFCKLNGLYLELSPLKIALADDTHFSNKGIFVDRKHPEGLYVAYISKNELLAKKASLAELQQDHKTLGVLLGYPACCIRFFEREIKDSKTMNLAHEPEHPLTNLSKRENDIALLSHFPCSPHCEHSKNIAAENFFALKEYSPKLADVFWRELQIKK